MRKVTQESFEGSTTSRPRVPQMNEIVRASEKDDEDDGSVSEPSQSNLEHAHGNGGGVVTEEARQEIAKAEDRAVLCFRTVMLLVLGVATAIVTYSAHVYLHDSETKKFEDSFHSDAEKVIATFGKHLDDTFGACDAFATNLMSQAQATNDTWPFVATTNFAVQAAKLLRLSKGYQVGFSQIVTPQNKNEWETFAVNNLDWLYQAFDVMEKDEDWKHPVKREFMTMPVFGFNGPLTEPMPQSRPMNTYAPSWIQYPIVPEAFLGFPFNFDGWQVPSVTATSQNAYANKKITISAEWTGLLFDPEDPVQNATVQAFYDFVKLFVPPDYNYKEPAGLAVIPMYNEMDAIRIDTSAADLEPVAYMSFSFFVKELLRDILPENSKGVHVVIDSACGKDHTFTYQLDGRGTTFLGPGDLHDTEYEKYKYSTTFGQAMDVTASGRVDTHYTGLPLDDDFCTKTMRIYPSRTMEDEYRSSDPLVTTILVACIFVFTTIIFIIYDLIVARRQKIVLGRALASGAIVNSLFPEQVRDQLYQEREAAKDRAKKEAGFINPVAEESASGVASNRPIAQLHENTTVFFADLAGFTKWSSNHSPVEVFELLETIYGSFDFIAKRRGVFKIETIGDCYVAVTGIPNEQPDHAVRMVKFARDCRSVMIRKLNELSESLGEDTKELEMRVGLHTGPTTAGVLRGERSRFQLFGDTVNTASRMESNGVPGKIHVSQATADALHAQGKGNWCVARPDKITAKGKGEMQTYFVEFVSSQNGGSASHYSVGATSTTSDEDLAHRLRSRLSSNDTPAF